MQAGSGSDPRWWALARRETASTRHGETRGAAAERQAGVPCAAGDPGGGGGSPTRGEGRGCVPRDEKGPGVARGRAARHGFTEEGTSESQAPEVPRSSPWRPSPGGRGRSGLRSATGPRAGPRSVGMPGGRAAATRTGGGWAGAHPSAGHSGPGAVREEGGAVFRGHGHPGHPGPGAGGGEREAARRGERGQDQGAQEKGDPDEGWCVRPAHPQRP